jgi:hypothetical protein
MSTSFNSSFVNKTNPSPYGQIIVLSQGMINRAFKQMWKLADDDSPLKTFTKNLRDGSMDVKLKAPSVHIHVTTPDPLLYFLMSMKSGSLTLYTSEDADDNTTKTWDVTDWIFAFSVTIAQKKIDKNSTEYSDVMSQMGLPEEDFSLAQLYIDSSSSTQYDLSQSSFGSNEDWNSETDSVQANFKTFVTKWLNLMSTKDCTILGYSAQAVSSDTNQNATSFPPTSIDYQRYPWIDPGNSSATKEDNIDTNALCYLMMSGFDEPPDPPAMQYSGTFVDDDTKPGIYSMNSTVFWDSWLLPLLQTINQGAEVIPEKPMVTYTSGKEYPYQVNEESSLGDNSKHPNADDTYFKFVAADQSGSKKWTWTGDPLTSTNSAQGDYDKQTVTQTSTSSTELTYTSGGQAVSLKGKNVFLFHCEFSSDVWSTFTFTTNWHLNMAIAAVVDGGVEFSRVDDPDGVKACTTTVDTDNHGVDWEGGTDAAAQNLSDELGDFLSSGTSQLENTLIGALENQHKLFLPAAGTFLMKDPIFNARGDMMVTLTYNGADPPDSPSSTSASFALPARKAKRTELSATTRKIKLTGGFKKT